MEACAQLLPLATLPRHGGSHSREQQLTLSPQLPLRREFARVILCITQGPINRRIHQPNSRQPIGLLGALELRAARPGYPLQTTYALLLTVAPDRNINRQQKVPIH